MAIRAQKDALLCLGTERLKRERDAPRIELQALGRRIAVVEVERSHRRRISTDRATSTGLGDQYRLHLSTPPRDGLSTAAAAPVVATPVEHEAGLTMPGARHLGFP